MQTYVIDIRRRENAVRVKRGKYVRGVKRGESKKKPLYLNSAAWERTYFERFEYNLTQESWCS